MDDLYSIQDKLDNDQGARSPVFKAFDDINFKDGVKFIETAYKELLKGNKYFRRVKPYKRGIIASHMMGTRVEWHSIFWWFSKTGT